MPGETIQIHGRADSDFDCYLALPQADGPVPAVVLAGAVHGVDKDLRALADEFASHGFIAAAPDLFWRTIPGSLTRPEKIKTGEADMADTLAELRNLPEFNGRCRGDGVLLRRALRHSRAKTARLRRRYFLPRHPPAGLHRRA